MYSIPSTCGARWRRRRARAKVLRVRVHRGAVANESAGGRSNAAAGCVRSGFFALLCNLASKEALATGHGRLQAALGGSEPLEAPPADPIAPAVFVDDDSTHDAT